MTDPTLGLERIVTEHGIWREGREDIWATVARVRAAGMPVLAVEPDQVIVALSETPITPKE